MKGEWIWGRAEAIVVELGRVEGGETVIKVRSMEETPKTKCKE